MSDSHSAPTPSEMRELIAGADAQKLLELLETVMSEMEVVAFTAVPPGDRSQETANAIGHLAANVSAVAAVLHRIIGGK